MVDRTADSVPVVETPSSAADNPSWARVGVIAALGFIAGVAWPRLAGVRLGPSLPDGASPTVTMTASSSAVAPPAEVVAVGAPAAPSTVVQPVAASAVPAPAPQPSATPVVMKSVQVEWEVALVRDSPKTGKVIARLPRGTQVRVGPVKDGWYPVQYGTGSGDGWVYRGAIGR
jgi:hypothetical protein